jgi:hypothetical protein
VNRTNQTPEAVEGQLTETNLQHTSREPAIGNTPTLECQGEPGVPKTITEAMPKCSSCGEELECLRCAYEMAEDEYLREELERRAECKQLRRELQADPEAVAVIRKYSRILIDSAVYEYLFGPNA